MTREGFLDTSVLIDALVPSHPDHHARAANLFDQANRGTPVLHLSVSVVLEATFVLTRSCKIPRDEVAPKSSNLLTLPFLKSPDKDTLLRALNLWARESPLSFADCYQSSSSSPWAWTQAIRSTGRWAAIRGSSASTRSLLLIALTPYWTYLHPV